MIYDRNHDAKRDSGSSGSNSLKEETANPENTLYVVGTPIGNLEDLSPRAARVLRSVALVAAEDTRVTRRLLTHIEARPRLLSFNEHNWRERLGSVLQALQDGDAALVSDAGMPAISDPGRELVAACAANGIRVESIPGPSAVTTALAVSGLPADSFLFLVSCRAAAASGGRNWRQPFPVRTQSSCSKRLTGSGQHCRTSTASSATGRWRCAGS